MMKSAPLILLLLASPVYGYTAKSRVWIAEFTTQRQEAAAPMAKLPVSVHQPVLDISVGNAVSQNFQLSTKFIRVMCEVPCQLQVGGNPSTSANVLPAMRPEYFGVNGGSYVSVAAVQ